MNVINTEFKIETRDNEFRIGKIKPAEVLALSLTVDLDDYKKSVELIDFVLEHTEVKMGDKWNPVKMPGKEVYMPLGIDTDYISIQKLSEYFIKEVLGKAFQTSRESI